MFQVHSEKLANARHAPTRKTFFVSHYTFGFLIYILFQIIHFVSVVISRETWLKEAENAERCQSVVTCQALIHATIALGVDEQVRLLIIHFLFTHYTFFFYHYTFFLIIIHFVYSLNATLAMGRRRAGAFTHYTFFLLIIHFV